MNDHAFVWLLAGGLAATCFAAIGARALREFSRHELEELCRRRNAREVFGEILRLHERLARGIENLVVFAAAVLIVAGTLWFHGVADRTASDSLWQSPWVFLSVAGVLAGIVLSAIMLWIPWAVVRLWAEPFLFRTWTVWKVTGRLAAPLVWASQLFDVVLHRVAGRTPEIPNGESFEDEIRTIVTEGHREGLLEEEACEMIEGVIELGDADVSEIMTPRTDMHMIHVGMPWDKMVAYAIDVGHTRIPIFDKNRDDIIGILYSKDLLVELAKDSDEPRQKLSDIIRPAYFVPETKAVNDLLTEFQKTRSHMAIVLDEYGGVSGLVTIEDVLEEIVGEIIDEYDEDVVEEIKKIDELTCEALGRTHVDEINDEMGLDLPDDGDFDTIGGFVFSELGRVPTPGETFVWRDTVRITVLEASRRRIERLRLELLDQTAQEIA